MMTKEDRDVALRQFVCQYGMFVQMNMAVEEMSELIKALMKYHRAAGADLTAARADIIDEIADVRIMVRQMEILFQCEDEVERRIDTKINRQLDRLAKRN